MIFQIKGFQDIRKAGDYVKFAFNSDLGTRNSELEIRDLNCWLNMLTILEYLCTT